MTALAGKLRFNTQEKGSLIFISIAHLVLIIGIAVVMAL
jgi:hypothetical protein